MFCPYCGKENRDGAKFCDGCGKKMAEWEAETKKKSGNEPSDTEIIRTDTTAPIHALSGGDVLVEEARVDANASLPAAGAVNSYNGMDVSTAEDRDTRPVRKSDNKKLLLLIAVVAVLMLVVAVVFIVVISNSSQKKYEEQLKLAERYLQELDYDRAITAYKAALEIDPKGEEAYLGLADAYVGKGELQAAIDILTEGLEKTDSETMEKKLAELEKQLTEEKAAELRALAEPTPTPEPEKPEGTGKTNWRGGDWINRDDILPFMNDEGYMVFGAYEQDGDETNGPEAIEWEVLEKNENGIFLVSRYVLDAQPYNTEETDVTWESSTLRSWLNGEFLNKAFTSGEQAVIRMTDLENPDYPKLGIPGGNNTSDRIFLLSADEVISHTGYNSWYEEQQNGYSMELIIAPTAFAKPRVYSLVIDEEYYYNNGTDIYDRWGTQLMAPDNYERWGGLASENYSRDCIGRESAYWWLRSPGCWADYACSVSAYGLGGWYSMYFVDSDFGIRPALYITE